MPGVEGSATREDARRLFGRENRVYGARGDINDLERDDTSAKVRNAKERRGRDIIWSELRIDSYDK